MLAKVLTVKAAVIAATVMAAGGVAVAAVTSNLPGQNGNSGQVSATSSVESTPEQNRGPDKSGEHGKPTDKDKPKGNEDKQEGKDTNGNPSPSPSLVGLCNAYTAGQKSEHGKALENPAFSALVTAAGGKENVDKFCDDLLTVAKPGHPEDKPSKDHPTGNDKNNSNSNGNGKGNGNGTPPSIHPGR
jgi:hypothetical protein